MSEQAITVTDTEIFIQAQYFCRTDNTCAYKDLLADMFSSFYTGQQIRIRANDGENLIANGLLTLVYEFSQLLDIPPEKITVETHDTKLTQPFNFEHLPLGLFLGANKFIPEFKHNLNNARFVGLVIGRFNMDRLRLAYEIDCEFSGNNYMIFQGQPWTDMNPFKELYQKEMDWFKNKQFDLDIKTTGAVGSVGFDEAYRNYPNIWNQYQIEVVAETDSVSSFWYTEKTAKCLATGKPFVLLNGHGTIARLQEMGFETFGSVIDESYDEKYLPTHRTHAIVNSLKILYNSTDRSEKIAEMYQIANRNQEHYKKYVTSQGHDVQSKI
jgi:hypothetical protein